MVQRVNNFFFFFYSSCFSIFYISGSLVKSVPFSPFKNFIFFVKNNNIIFKSIWPWWASKKFFAPSLFERWRWEVASLPLSLSNLNCWTGESRTQAWNFLFERWRWQVASPPLSLSNLNCWTGESSWYFNFLGFRFIL